MTVQLTVQFRVKMTCFSAEDYYCHVIKDPLSHYLGCVEFCDRENFFEPSNLLWQEILEHHTNLGNDRRKVEETVARKEEWKANCESELRRIDFLRKTLEGDEYDNHLVQRLEESSKAWRKSLEYEDNINRVKAWRVKKNKRNSPAPVFPSASAHGQYKPEKDMAVPLIQFENGKGVNENDQSVWNTFPDQKTTLSKLLYAEENLLNRDRHTSSNRIRYFHIHSNNMIVSYVCSCRKKSYK